MVSYLREKGLGSRNSDPHVLKKDYPGAFVFEPTPGVYDHITDFDFKSLYPSLMITYNIGVNSFVMKTQDPELGFDIAYQPEKLPSKFNVIIDPMYENKVMSITPEQLFKKVEESNLVHTINGCFFKPHKEVFSSFGEVVDMLMTSRDEYKKQMFDAIEAKDDDKRKFFFTRQLVYKVLANTLYGVVANKSFRFFDTSLASAITLSGQEALKLSIIYGHEYMKSLAEGKPIEEPSPLTKREMFDSDMPDRSNEYILTGDTDSIFCCFEKVPEEKSVERILEWCSGIETYLNDDKMIDLINRHRVDPDFNRLKLKNELIISRGLFLAKKRYAIRVINNEGKDVDEINFMGVEIKRSDYPSASKEFMKTLSDMILKAEKVKLSKILQYVQSEERNFKEMIENGDKGISRPITWGKEN
jgi:DNA polymerase elongation subunit (family B)